MKYLLEGLSELFGINIYGTHDVEKSTSVLSFTIENRQVSELGLKLDEEFGVLSRVGLHCAPAAHKTIKTFPNGTVRLSPGIFTNMEDIDKTIKAIKELSKG
jgi:selenocysteine lyase/cysteine desulfurase